MRPELSALIAACHSKVCAPPPIGDGGSEDVPGSDMPSGVAKKLSARKKSTSAGSSVTAQQKRRLNALTERKRATQARKRLLMDDDVSSDDEAFLKAANREKAAQNRVAHNIVQDVRDGDAQRYKRVNSSKRGPAYGVKLLVKDRYGTEWKNAGEKAMNGGSKKPPAKKSAPSSATAFQKKRIKALQERTKAKQAVDRMLTNTTYNEYQDRMASERRDKAEADIARNVIQDVREGDAARHKRINTDRRRLSSTTREYYLRKVLRPDWDAAGREAKKKTTGTSRKKPKKA